MTFLPMLAVDEVFEESTVNRSGKSPVGKLGIFDRPSTKFLDPVQGQSAAMPASVTQMTEEVRRSPFQGGVGVNMNAKCCAGSLISTNGLAKHVNRV